MGAFSGLEGGMLRVQTRGCRGPCKEGAIGNTFP